MHASIECLTRAAVTCAAVGLVLLALCQNTQAKPLEWNRLSKRIFCNYNGCDSGTATKRTIDAPERIGIGPPSYDDTGRLVDTARQDLFAVSDAHIVVLKERIRKLSEVLENLKSILQREIVEEIGLFESNPV